YSRLARSTLLSKTEIALRLSGAFPINRSENRLSSKLVTTLLGKTKLYGKPFKLTATHSALSTQAVARSSTATLYCGRGAPTHFLREQAASRSQGCANPAAAKT